MRRLPLFLVMLSSVLWGTVGVSSRLMTDIAPVHPFAVGFYRLTFSVPVLAVAGVVLLRRAMWAVDRRDLLGMAGIGAMMALYQVCYFASIVRVGVSVATLVTLCSAPVITAALTAILQRKPPSRRVLGALALALLGTALLIEWQPAEGSAASTLAGVALALGSASGYAVVTILSQGLTQRRHPLQITAIGFACGAAALLAIALGTGTLTAAFPATGWAILLYMGVIPTALAYVLFVAGMRGTSPTVATIATLLEPLTATLLATFLFGERLSSQALLGAALLVATMGMLLQQGKSDSR
jgi:DME family drug/metabolite transporter